MRIWTATDECGNAGDPTEQYVQLFDIIAPVPVITCPADYTVSADENCAADTTPAAAVRPRPRPRTTATTMWTSPFPTATVEPTSLCEGQYSFIRTWTADAMDECDNPASVSCDQLITVEDTTGPRIDTGRGRPDGRVRRCRQQRPARGLARRQRRCRGQRQLQRHDLEPQRRHLERPLRRHTFRDGDLHRDGRLRQQQRPRRPRSPSRTPRPPPSSATSR